MTPEEIREHLRANQMMQPQDWAEEDVAFQPWQDEPPQRRRLSVAGWLFVAAILATGALLWQYLGRD